MFQWKSLLMMVLILRICLIITYCGKIFKEYSFFDRFSIENLYFLSLDNINQITKVHSQHQASFYPSQTSLGAAE